MEKSDMYFSESRHLKAADRQKSSILVPFLGVFISICQADVAAQELTETPQKERDGEGRNSGGGGPAT